jgi:hypothetical protein
MMKIAWWEKILCQEVLLRISEKRRIENVLERTYILIGHILMHIKLSITVIKN